MELHRNVFNGLRRKFTNMSNFISWDVRILKQALLMLIKPLQDYKQTDRHELHTLRT
jgi:hypothetical protein